MDDRWISLKLASEQTGKSITTLKRIVKKHGIPTRKQGKSSNSMILIDRSYLLATLGTVSQPQGQSMIKPVTSPQASRASQKEENRLIDMLETQVMELKEQLKQQATEHKEQLRELKAETDRLRAKLDAAETEIKALLRQGQSKQNKSGVFGFIDYIRGK